MGAVTFSIDSRLVTALLQAIPVEVFVETGTFRGDTLAGVKNHFRELYSIELSRSYFEAARARFARDSHIQLILGNSAAVLPNILAGLRERSVLFFLDAHWCVADHAAGQVSQCPLLNELRAIGTLRSDSIVVIDDARLFLSTPPAPHEISQWPTFGEVLTALTALSNSHDLMVVNDYIVYFPLQCRAMLTSYAREFGTDWLQVFNTNEQRKSELALLRARCVRQERELEHKARAPTSKDAEPSGLTSIRAGARAVHRLISPKLGKLEHHPPIPLRFPKRHVCLTRQVDLPVISVVTPSFQQVEFLERTLKSILDQNYTCLEYFVQDGGSNDGSAELLHCYADRLDGFESTPDRGQADAINRGFSRTSGEIMSWLNSDDLLLPGALEYVGDYFARHPEVDVVYGNRVLIDEHDMEIGRWILPPHDSKVLSWADFIPQETLFWRRSIWEKAGEHIDEEFRFALDWDLLLRFRDAGAQFVRLPRFLGAFRVHALQKTSAEIHDAGFDEMHRLRKRCTGLDTVSNKRLRKEIAPYMLRHVIHDAGWRIRQRF